MYYKHGEHNNALEDLNKSLLMIESNDKIALKKRADIYYILEQYDDALNDLNTLLQIDQHNSWALSRRAYSDSQNRPNVCKY